MALRNAVGSDQRCSCSSPWTSLALNPSFLPLGNTPGQPDHTRTTEAQKATQGGAQQQTRGQNMLGSWSSDDGFGLPGRYLPPPGGSPSETGLQLQRITRSSRSRPSLHHSAWKLADSSTPRQRPAAHAGGDGPCPLPYPAGALHPRVCGRRAHLLRPHQRRPGAPAPHGKRHSAARRQRQVSRRRRLD